MTFEQQSSFSPSAERAPHHTSTENPLRAVLLRLSSVAGFSLPPPYWSHADTAPIFLIVGGFYSEVALQKREAEGTVHTKHQLNLGHDLEGT